MKLWREHYAPKRIAIDGDVAALNAVATLSEDGGTLIFKAINPTTGSVPVRLVPAGGFKAASATFEVVAPGALSSRNTLTSPQTVKVEAGTVSVSGDAVQFTLPPLSAGVVAIKARP
jgi:alpha-L-arabinofuranosidase